MSQHREDRILRYLARHVAAYGAPATLKDVARDLGIKSADAFAVLSDLEKRNVVVFSVGRVTSGGWRIRETAAA